MQCAVEIARTVNSRRPGGFEVGVGVNTGKVVAGSIGGAGRLSFSVIGDAVNLCSRVEAADPRHRRPGADHRPRPGPSSRRRSRSVARGEREIRGYDRRVELFAPLVPEAAVVQEGGSDDSMPLPESEVGGLGRAPVPGDGLGKGTGGGTGTRTLPGG